MLAEALAAGGEARRMALLDLDSRTDEPGLGALAPAGSDPISPDAAQAMRDIATTLADAVADGLDDTDRAIRATALSVLAKLGDARITAARIAAAVADGDADLAEGAVRAARQLVRGDARRGRAVDRRGGAPGARRWPSARLAGADLADAARSRARPRMPGSGGRDAVRAAATGDRNAVVRAAARAAIGPGAEQPG